MSFEEALNILGFENISDLNEISIKKHFRSRMKKNHPDVGGSLELAKKLNEAHEIVLATFKKLKKLESMVPDKEKSCILDFGTYIKVCTGSEVDIKHQDTKERISKYNLNKFSVYLNIDIVIIDSSGIETRFNTFEHRNHEDRYKVLCPITFGPKEESKDIRIKAYGKDLTLTISKSLTTLTLTFDYDIKLSVMLEKRVAEE